MSWVYKGPKTNLGKHPTALAGNFPKQFGHHTEGQVVRLYLVIYRQLAEFRNQRPVSTNDAFEQAGMSQSVDTLIDTVTRSGCEYQ